MAPEMVFAACWLVVERTGLQGGWPACEPGNLLLELRPMAALNSKVRPQ